MDRPDDKEPQLLEPQPIGLAPSPKRALAALGGTGLAAFLALGLVLSGADDTRHPPQEQAQQQQAQGILVPVAETDREAFEQALEGLQLSKLDKQRIRAAVKEGQLDLGLLIAWDWGDQDSDVVTITSAGFTQTVTIQTTPTSITIPYDGLGVVTLTGVRSGRGPVTVGVVNAGEPLRLRGLEIGESIQVMVP